MRPTLEEWPQSGRRRTGRQERGKFKGSRISEVGTRVSEVGQRADAYTAQALSTARAVRGTAVNGC